MVLFLRFLGQNGASFDAYVNDEKNGKLYKTYKALADMEANVIFGGRLGEYKYYDMDATVAAALEKCRQELK